MLPFELNSDYFGDRAVYPRIRAHEYTDLEVAAICRLWWDGSQWQRSFGTPRAQKIAKSFIWEERDILRELHKRGMPMASVSGWPRR